MLCLQWSGAATKRVTIVRCSSRQSLLDLREKRNRRARWKNLVKNKMARMHSYMLHPHGIPQSLALPNSGLPRFGRDGILEQASCQDVDADASLAATEDGSDPFTHLKSKTGCSSHRLFIYAMK
ncbi:uncharacterized protein [Aegilops tauschii subsp. strangulata]|uniref:uncharacterized protein isoform X2 n=1 Tax=Aegilops tauschii subsp. strangulata TaxID=200361 RepID=UPI00098AA7FA